MELLTVGKTRARMAHARHRALASFPQTTHLSPRQLPRALRPQSETQVLAVICAINGSATRCAVGSRHCTPFSTTAWPGSQSEGAKPWTNSGSQHLHLHWRVVETTGAAVNLHPKLRVVGVGDISWHSCSIDSSEERDFVLSELRLFVLPSDHRL